MKCFGFFGPPWGPRALGPGVYRQQLPHCTRPVLANRKYTTEGRKHFLTFHWYFRYSRYLGPQETHDFWGLPGCLQLWCRMCVAFPCESQPVNILLLRTVGTIRCAALLAVSISNSFGVSLILSLLVLPWYYFVISSAIRLSSGTAFGFIWLHFFPGPNDFLI